VLGAARAVSVGIDLGVCYLTATDPADLIVLNAVAEKADELIEERTALATWGEA
jgi:hypothetical protein